jgi:hypothetical protein
MTTAQITHSPVPDLLRRLAAAIGTLRSDAWGEGFGEGARTPEGDLRAATTDAAQAACMDLLTDIDRAVTFGGPAAPDAALPGGTAVRFTPRELDAVTRLVVEARNRTGDLISNVAMHAEYLQREDGAAQWSRLEERHAVLSCASVALVAAGGRDTCPRCGGDHDRIDSREACPRMLACTVCGRGFDPSDPQHHALVTGHQPDAAPRRFPGAPS